MLRAATTQIVQFICTNTLCRDYHPSTVFSHMQVIYAKLIISSHGYSKGRNVQEMLLDTLPNGRQLTYGEYKESSRPLRRLLKQIGSGSLDNGIDIIQSNEEALASVSQLIGIPREVVPR